MGRKPLLEYDGGVYHLIQRGNNREYIFCRNEDKEFLLGILREYQIEMGFECYGYVIMGNHYHLVLKRHDIPIKEIMHRINSHFSRYYNQKNKRTGHVFENRYKGCHVNDDRYLLSLMRYVHQNPVAAKICRQVWEYPWSSDAYYRKNNGLGLVSIDAVLGIFSENRSQALPAYCEFMDAKKLEQPDDFEPPGLEQARITTAPAIPAPLVKATGESTPGKPGGSQSALETILKRVAADEEIYAAIKSGSRKRFLSPYKKAFIEQALRDHYTMREIGAFISVSEVAVYKMSVKE